MSAEFLLLALITEITDDDQHLSIPAEPRHGIITVPALDRDRNAPAFILTNDTEHILLNTAMPDALVSHDNASSAHLPADRVNIRHDPMRLPTLMQKSRYFLRSIGLRIISFEIPSRKHKPEDKKVVINMSVWVALSRCGVHIIPLLGTITLLWFNVHGFFIGASLAGPRSWSNSVKLEFLQFAAKAHELLIMASTATVVFHVIRNQVLFGQSVSTAWSFKLWNNLLTA